MKMVKEKFEIDSLFNIEKNNCTSCTVYYVFSGFVTTVHCIGQIIILYIYSM